MSGDNVLWESAGRKGDPDKKRKRCRACRKDKRLEAREAAEKDHLPGSSAGRRRNPDGMVIRTNVDRAKDAFEYALEHVKAACRGNPEPFMDWEIEDAPSPATAEALCADCPLLQLCREAAWADPPPIGVWGGQVWLDGQIYTGGTK